MKSSALRWIPCALFASASLSASGQTLVTVLSRTEILAIMHRVDAWQLAHPVMLPTDRNWERSTWYTGVMEDWKATHDTTFFDQALDWGKQNQWQVGTERENGANRLFCSETWLELYLARKNQAMIGPTVVFLATPDPNSPAGAKRWYLHHDMPYVDSLYGASALAMLTRATRDRKYLVIMRSFFDDVTDELWDKDAGLYYRDPTFIGKRTASDKKIFWSRGNGWAFAGLARILEYLPADDPDRPKYLAIYCRMALELMKRQSADGFWRANLDDPKDLPNPESSGTALFCFAFAWGINHNVLDRREYLPATQKAFAALVGVVSPEGRVEWGQLVDKQPGAVQRENTHEYVTGAFLLAAGEMYKMNSPKAR